jgi:hypothetical protein
MNARTDWKRWVGTGLVVGLLALLAVANVQAQAPDVAEWFAAPAYGVASLAIHCETGILEEGDPFMSPDHVDAVCPGLVSPKIESIVVTGNVSWVQVLASNGPELHVYVKRDGVWERVPYSPAAEWEYLYMLEQEARSMGVLDPAPQPEVAATDVSIDLRGESYWDEFFGRQDTGAQPLVVSPLDETNSIDLYERETHLASGSALNTLADLALALFDRDWAPHAAGEDHSRETK